MEDRLDGEALRGVLGNHLGEPAVDGVQPGGERLARAGPNHAGGDERMAATVGVNYAVARPLRSAVNAEDSHGP